MKLYEMTEEYRLALADLSDLDLPKDVVDDTLEGLAGEVQEKALAVGAFVLNVDADIQTLKDHKSKIDERIKALTNRNEGLKNYLRSNMEACGISKIESPMFNVSIRKPSKSVDILDKDLIPEEYIKTTITTTPIKADISKAIKAGEMIPGAQLIDGKAGIIIK